MKIILTANIVPFMPGGADAHIRGLLNALVTHGHEVELIRFPFRFCPLSGIEELMVHCEGQDFNIPNGVSVDRVISLQFPGYGVRHAHHTVWLMHQHRAVYDCLAESAPPELHQLQQKITAYDNRVLARSRKLFANSQRVARRLLDYNGLKAKPLYHPPPLAEKLYHAEPWDYIFCPSRLESLKRQDLLIRAAALVKAPLHYILAGDGGQFASYQQLIRDLGLCDKVHLLGRIKEAEKLSWYAHSFAVFFGPRDEDYGYITLEAMLAAKPVITCSDSGGTLEFVEDSETGFVVDPTPEAIAQAIEEMYGNQARTAAMGHAGREVFLAKEISWDNVVGELV